MPKQYRIERKRNGQKAWQTAARAFPGQWSQQDAVEMFHKIYIPYNERFGDSYRLYDLNDKKIAQIG